MSLLDDMPQKWLDYATARTCVSLPNCFTWSTARISWAVNKAQPLDSVRKVNFASQLWNQHSPEFSQSQTPVVGALLIWDIWGYIDGVYCNHGHVANVESVNADGTITWSQSNYGGTLFEIVRGNPKTMYGTFKGYLVHQDLKKASVVKKSNMEEEDWAVRFKNDTPIIIHKDSSDGPSYGTFVKGETQVYTHKGAGNGHRWIGWTEKLNGKDQFYVCAISGSEVRGQDMWVDLIDPQTIQPKKEESKPTTESESEEYIEQPELEPLLIDVEMYKDKGLNIEIDLVDKSKWPYKCPFVMDGEFFVVHNAGTQSDPNAKSLNRAIWNTLEEKSWHFSCDESGLVQGLPLNRNGWHAGDGLNGQGNRKGIAIEICRDMQDSNNDNFLIAEQNCAKFMAIYMIEKGWDISHVKKHQDFMDKYCPHKTLDLGWQRFLDTVQAYINMYSPEEDKPVEDNRTLFDLIVELIKKILELLSK